MKRTLLTLAAIAGLALATTGATYAEGNPPARPGDESSRQPAAEDMIGCHDPADASSAALPFEAPWISLALANAERIGLSEDQARRLDILRSDFQHEAERRTHDIVTAEQNLQGLLTEAAVDEARVRKQLDEVGRLRNILRLGRIETLLAGRNVLSAEQFSGLQALFSRPADAMHEAMMGGDLDQEAAAPPAGTM